MLSPLEKCVHFSFRPANKDILQILELCPKMAVIEMPQSLRYNLAKDFQTLLRLSNIKLITGEMQGYRADMHGYACEYPDN
jgi:Protein of unknown function (DUF1699)